MPKHVARRLLLIAAAAVVAVAVAARYYFLDPSYYRYGNYRGDAPKIGDRTAWLPRMSQGLDLLVRSAIRGHEGMPARGGMADLTDSEVRAAVIHMFGQGAAPTPGSAAPAARPDPHFYKAIEGAEIYLGVVSAETLRAQHPGSDAESSMHRGIPSGKGYYHVNVSLFDTDTKAQIMDAQVRARVARSMR